VSAVAYKTRFGRLSEPGAFRGDVNLIASKISFSVIGGRSICLAYYASYISSRSAASGLRKKVRLNTSTFSLTSVTLLIVYRYRSEGVTLSSSVSLPLAYLATL
jgi:hypothetical protein